MLIATRKIVHNGVEYLTGSELPAMDARAAARLLRLGAAREGAPDAVVEPDPPAAKAVAPAPFQGLPPAPEPEAVRGPELPPDKEPEDMSKAELAAELAALGVPVEQGAKKPELLAQLKAALAADDTF